MKKYLKKKRGQATLLLWDFLSFGFKLVWVEACLVVLRLTADADLS